MMRNTTPDVHHRHSARRDRGGGFALTLFVDASFLLVLLAAGLAYELWTSSGSWSRRANSFSPAPLALVVLTGTVTLSVTATIFFEGVKAGLLTFGGAFTVISFLQDASLDAHHWLTDSRFVDGLAISGVLPAPLIIFSTFVGYVAGRLGGALAMTLGIFLDCFPWTNRSATASGPARCCAEGSEVRLRAIGPS
jgi:chromate transporter